MTLFGMSGQHNNGISKRDGGKTKILGMGHGNKKKGFPINASPKPVGNPAMAGPSAFCL